MVDDMRAILTIHGDAGGATRVILAIHRLALPLAARPVGHV